MSNSIHLRKVWIDTGVIQNGVEQLKEITNQVMIVCNLLAGSGPDKSQNYFKASHKEAEALSRMILTFIDETKTISNDNDTN